MRIIYNRIIKIYFRSRSFFFFFRLVRFFSVRFLQWRMKTFIQVIDTSRIPFFFSFPLQSKSIVEIILNSYSTIRISCWKVCKMILKAKSFKTRKLVEVLQKTVQNTKLLLSIWMSFSWGFSKIIAISNFFKSVGEFQIDDLSFNHCCYWDLERLVICWFKLELVHSSF